MRRRPIRAPSCRAARASLPVARRRRRIVDLPLNATEDRVAGTVDIARALREGERALEPGLLAEANRGILYVDEINLLDDHLTDILLDAAALGVNVVEREGVSISHPARFLLVGTMNEEEGELRPQIADRIGLRGRGRGDRRAGGARARSCGGARRSRRDPDALLGAFAASQAELAEELAVAERLLPDVRVPDHLYPAVGRVTVKAGVTSHRADVTIVECAKAGAALAGRDEVAAEDSSTRPRSRSATGCPSTRSRRRRASSRQLVRRLLDEALELERSKKVEAGPVT